MTKAETRSFAHGDHSFVDIARAVQDFLNRRFNEISNRGKVHSVHQTPVTTFDDGNQYGTLVTIIFEED